MSWVNAGFAPWLALAAAPLAIHLLTRQAVRPYVLPTFRFLQKSVAQQSRLFRLRHVLLLLLRTALVILLVSVFLKPTLTAPLAGAGGQRAVVIVLDVSLSMGWRSGGLSSMQRAQAQAERVLDRLQPGDRAGVILAGAAPASVLPQLSTDHATLRQAVKSAAPTEERCDVPAAVALAAEQLGKTDAPRRELYLVSDFQRSNWADVKLDAVPRSTQVIFAGTDESARDNMAVTGIKFRPSSPRAGDDVSVEVEVWNGSGQPRPLPVTLKAGGDVARTQTVMVPPYASGTAAFPVRFSDPGRYICTASVPGDSLLADDVRYAVADLQHAMTVYLLTDEDAGGVGSMGSAGASGSTSHTSQTPQTSHTSGAYFIARALNPTPELPGGIRVITKRAADVSESELRSADAVVMANVATMPADKLPALLKYVQGGGALLVFLYGDRVAVEMDTLHRLAGKGEGLAFLPTQQVDVSRQGKGYVGLAEARYESKLLRVFKDPSAADLGKIQFRRFFLTTEPDSRAELLLKYEDGTPAAARRAIGAGNVLLCNFSPAPQDSDLARQEVFPPLLHEMLKGIASREGERREFNPGGAASVTIPPTKGRVTVIDPLGNTRAATVDRVGGGVVIERAERAGVYSVREDGREAALVAVNVHPDESDLRTIDPRELQSQRDRLPAYLVGQGGSATIEGLTKARPVWPWLLVAAFGVLLAEHAVAGLKPRPGRRTKIHV